MPTHRFLPLSRLRASGDPYALRATQVRDGNARGSSVLVHLRAARRTRNNLLLDFASTLGKKVVVTESEPAPEQLARARYVVVDEFPTLPVPDYATHLFDGNGILPMRAMEKEQYSARFFRDRAFRLFEQFWLEMPPAPVDLTFLDGYARLHNRTPKHTSGFSVALHTGELGIHELVAAVLCSGAPEEDIEAFLEQAIIRRELSFNLCHYNPRYDSLDALPAWARKTLDKHRRDRRKPVYTYDEFERAATHDEVWNLAQRQLLVTGTMHGYLRMLWGKKIIEWSATPEEAHRTMVRLHDVYALDGRDPNTHAGILWCFGKHDRPWAPERPIFGTIRWMSSEQTAKKVLLRDIEAELHTHGRPRAAHP